MSVAATTTTEEDLHTKSKRKVDLIWEVTQAAIAITVVLANIAAAFVTTSDNSILANSFFLVIGFYFGRTNHARSGGVVSKVST